MPTENPINILEDPGPRFLTASEPLDDLADGRGIVWYGVLKMRQHLSRYALGANRPASRRVNAVFGSNVTVTKEGPAQGARIYT